MKLDGEKAKDVFSETMEKRHARAFRILSRPLGLSQLPGKQGNSSEMQTRGEGGERPALPTDSSWPDRLSFVAQWAIRAPSTGGEET